MDLHLYCIDFQKTNRQSWVLFSAIKYLGSDRSAFEEAVSYRVPGLYTCHLSQDEVATLPLPVEPAMHVSIVGDDSMPQWNFTGEGPTFTVAGLAYLNLAYMTVPGGQVSTMRGGEVSIDHVQMQGTQLHVFGSLAVSNSQLVDVQFETKSATVMTMVAVAAGGSLTVDSSQLIHSGAGAASVSTGNPSCWSGEYTAVRCCNQASGPTGDDSCWSGTFDFAFCCPSAAAPTQDNVTDPFPCNGANMACTGQHAGSVTVAGPFAINTAAPLVCDAVTGA